MNMVGEGRESKAFSLNNNTIILIGKNKTAFNNYSKQKIIYNILETKINFMNIPHNVNLIKPCSKYPFGAMTLSYVKGKPLNLSICSNEEKEKLGQQFARFIYQMQIVGEQLNKEEIATLKSLQTKTDDTAVDECLVLVKKHLTDEEYKKLIIITNKYKKLIKNKPYILQHGDLGGSNVLIDENTNIIGVIDFEEVGFYIPEYKFKSFRKDKVLLEALTNEYYKLSGILVNDIDFMEVCEIITMILHLRRFYQLGENEINMRVKIIRDLLNNYIIQTKKSL